MNQFLKRIMAVTACLSMATLVGCSSTARTNEAPAAESQPETKPVVRSGWPTRRTDGSMAWSSLAYPTGDARSSAVGIEYGVPREVRLNSAFDSLLVVTNLTNVTLSDVEVTQTMQDGYAFKSSVPAADVNRNGTVQWVIGELGPRESKTIRVASTATKEGRIGACTTVSYNNLLCATIPVVQPQLKLTKTGPAEVLLCDPITYNFTVSNTGTGAIQNVKINDPLPAGLTTMSGGRTITFDAGSLAAGQSKNFSAKVKAERRGTFANKATASGGGGMQAASGTVSTAVRQPVLKITKTGPERRYIGRGATYDVTVTNTGDGVAANTVVEDMLPAGARFVSASNNGRHAAGKVTWTVGDLAPNASRKMTVTIDSNRPGTLRDTARATADCADAVSASAETIYEGIPAILLEVVDIDDPVEVGGQTTYVITATNQGSAPGTNIAIVATLEPNLSYASSSGATQGSHSAGKITFAPLRSLAAGEKATWRVVVNAVRAGDTRFTIQMDTDQLTREVRETEATNIYE